MFSYFGFAFGKITWWLLLLLLLFGVAAHCFVCWVPSLIWVLQAAKILSVSHTDAGSNEYNNGVIWESLQRSTKGAIQLHNWITRHWDHGPTGIVFVNIIIVIFTIQVLDLQGPHHIRIFILVVFAYFCWFEEFVNIFHPVSNFAKVKLNEIIMGWGSERKWMPLNSWHQRKVQKRVKWGQHQHKWTCRTWCDCYDCDVSQKWHPCEWIN